MRTREVRKIVTILFADVVGSTELGERLDPEALRRVLGRYYQEMSAILDHHGGTVEKFIGDAVMAVFGIPAVHEDDALRAVRAAQDMRERLTSLNDELDRQWGVRLLIRIGVNTGEVVAGGADVPTYATGDAVNVAARLQQEASPGEILLGRETHRLVRDFVLAEALEPIEVKGKGTAVETIRLVSVIGDERESGRFASPMVGRERERRRLLDAFEQAVTDSSCQLFTILGAAGVGKSRLVRELLRDLAGSALVARGRCLPYGEGITYWPILEAVRDAAELEDSESAEASLAKIAGVLESEPDAEIVSLRIAEVIGLSHTASATEEISWAVRTFFEALARRRPLVLLFDDIHWGETTFLDLVDHISDWTRDAPILLVCIARSELLDARPQWGGGKLNATSILLEPLTDTESLQLVENLVGTHQLEDQPRRAIVEAADGNPLFVEEMLTFLIEGGADGTAVEVPPTIQALLAARLDRLDNGERTAIEAASVEGKAFHESSVAALVARPRDEVRRELQALVRKELIRPDRGVFSGDRAYRFRHLLIRDAAYESIPKDARAALHETHAAWLEERATDRGLEFEQIIGYHLEQAYRHRADLGPVDEGTRALGSRAAERLGEAGRRAFARGDAPAALKLIARAAALLPPDDASRVDLVPNVRVMQGSSGDFRWADRVLDEAIETGDPRLHAHADVQRAFLRLFTETEVRPTELMEIARRAIAVLESPPDERGLARAWRLMAQAHYLERQAGPSADASEHALGHARRAGDPLEELETVQWLSVALFFGPSPAPEAARRCRNLLQEIVGKPNLEIHVLGALAYLVGMQGEFDEATQLLGHGRQLMEELGEGWHFPAFSAWLGLWHRDPAAAERELRPGYEILKRVGERAHFCTVASLLARIAYAQERYDEALALTRECEDASRPNDVECQIHWRGTRAKVLARSPQPAAAEDLAREAVSIAEGSDFLCVHGDALLDLAEVLSMAGSQRDAIERVGRAIELYELKGDVVSAARATATLEAFPIAPRGVR